MSRDYAKQKHEAASTSGSFSDDPTSPTDGLPLLRWPTSSTAPSSQRPSVPNTPSQSFSPTFSYAESFDGDRLPTVSQLNSPPHSRYPSRRNSSFSSSTSAAVADRRDRIDIHPTDLRERLLDPSLRGEHLRSKPKVKNGDVLEKPKTGKLTKFWTLALGGDESIPLPSILEDLDTPAAETPSPAAASLGEKLKRAFRSPAVKMDSTRLAPGPFDAPNRQRQIQDARDMYQTVVRNAERSSSEVPPYDFIELIGKGGYGRVYKCRKRSNGSLVAIKILNIDDSDFQEHVHDKDNAIESFRKEVAILQQLKDNKAQNINLIHDAFDMHNQLWIVSDYCTGGSLRTLMRANARKGFEEHFIIPVARELAIAVKSVHDIGVIHRDIKCANVYVNEEGDIQLGDFGIVGDVDDGSSKRRTIVGTPHYLPLEMHTSRSHQTDEAYSTEVDIWSFGITVYEMATGQPPYTNVPMERLAEATANAPRLEGGDYSDGLRDFVAFCLNGDPRERPSAEEVLKHPYIADTTQRYPTSGLVKLIERYAVWEYGGGQRQSLFFAGGAAAPVVPDEPAEPEGDDALDWNFSTSDSFNADFGRRMSQMIGTHDFADPHFEAPPGAGLPPIVTKDLSRLEEVEQHFKELSANRGERSLDRLFHPSEDTPYELHTPVDNDDNISEPLSDLPLRNLSGTGPLRESLIDLDDVGGLDLTVPTFNFDFGDVPTLKARTGRQAGREEAAGEEEEYEYGGANGPDPRRGTMDWTFPAGGVVEKKRATMDWTFNTAVPAEPGDPEPALQLPPTGIEGLPAGFRPTLKHTTTEPVGHFNDFRHPAHPLLPMPTSSSPTRDSMASMIDLDLGLADPSEIPRPSTAGSATTDLTSGNPFDLEDDPAQNARDRDRFSHHKHWQSEGGGGDAGRPGQRRSYRRMPMHSRGSSLTSDADSSSAEERLDRGAGGGGGGVFGYEYGYSRQDHPHPIVPLELPEEETGLDHWPNFGSNSGLDASPRFPAGATDAQRPRDPDERASSHQQQQEQTGQRGYGASPSPHPTSGAYNGSPQPSSPPPRELEFPDPVAPHADALREAADAAVVLAELDRLLEDFGGCLRATGRALREHSGMGWGGGGGDGMGEGEGEGSSGTDEGFESSGTGATTAPGTGDEDGF
ncbi:hypothetical protein LTR53_015938 [Teratosphaeriaceae sp. CCFEE 6253]|nr:hypothetical protein LTR53_015938 [Teratosphaeriaceae sp. CCFEE 6253]